MLITIAALDQGQSAEKFDKGNRDFCTPGRLCLETVPTCLTDYVRACEA